MNHDFTYWGLPLTYCDNPYNDSRMNERAVEVPIAAAFLDGQLSMIPAHAVGVEIGNVMSHYRPVSHRVVDRYEDGAENIDVFDLTGQFDWILAVSTIEHVRWDEAPKDADGSGLALRHLLGLLAPGGVMLVTVPFGWHPFLDTEILAGVFPGLVRECTMIREGDGWVQTEGIEHRRYAATTRWAEAVWIAEFVA